MKSLPPRRATTPVVPLPQNGSRTTQGTVGAPQPQPGSQAMETETVLILRWPIPLFPDVGRSLSVPRTASSLAGWPSTQRWRTHERLTGAPQAEQQPRSDVPASTHGSTSASGKGAKCSSPSGRA